MKTIGLFAVCKLQGRFAFSEDSLSLSRSPAVEPFDSLLTKPYGNLAEMIWVDAANELT